MPPIITSLSKFVQNLTNANSKKRRRRSSSKRKRKARNTLEEAKLQIQQFDTSFNFEVKEKQRREKPDFEKVIQNMNTFAKKSKTKRKRRKNEKIVELAARREFSWKDASSPLLNFMPIN